LKVPKS